MPSQWQYIKFGDIEAATINILRTASEITGFAGGAPTIRADYIGYSMGDRWILVIREGGSQAWPTVDRPRVDLQVLAEKRSVASELAQVARAVIFREIGQQFPAYGLNIADAKLETAPFRAPDKETGSYRYVLAIRFTCTPIS